MRFSSIRQRTGLLALILCILLFVSITMGVSIGSVSIPFGRVWGIILHQLFPDWQTFARDWPKNEVGIVWQLRLPRVLLGSLVGAGLMMAGATIQSLVRNSLADPYLLGISSGACAGAVLAILFAGKLLGAAFSGMPTVSLLAFLGALLAFALVFLIASRGSGLTPMRMVLSGLAVSYIFMAMTNFLVYLNQRSGAETAMFWMLGGLGGARWDRLPIPFAVTSFCLVVLMLQSRSLNALLLGDESAAALGVDVQKFRRFLFVVTSVLTGALVAASGSIGFVGLVVPHIMRMTVGADHRRVLPLGALLGAVFLIWADVFSRTVMAPRELPLGIVTGFVGAPFFIWLLGRGGHK
ncbi:FecCD family ABC transporter permease [Pyramidobacter porci]